MTGGSKTLNNLMLSSLTILVTCVLDIDTRGPILHALARASIERRGRRLLPTFVRSQDRGLRMNQ